MKFSDLPQHHAVLVVHGERDVASSALWDELRVLSPAHRFFDQTVLDIDTSRAIISWANAPYHTEKIGLISFHTAGIPAQNALLKILEEPRAGVRFILVTSNKASLIDTVLSRVHHVQDDAQNRVSDNALLFLETGYVFRMKLPFIVEMLARVDEEGRKDREAVRGFILSLTPALAHVRAPSRYTLEILQVASYAADPSVSGKTLIE